MQLIFKMVAELIHCRCRWQCTDLLMCYSFEEAGRYLETYKSYENKPPDLIMEKSEGTYMSQVNITSFTVCHIMSRAVLFLTMLSNLLLQSRSCHATHLRKTWSYSVTNNGGGFDAFELL